MPDSENVFLLSPEQREKYVSAISKSTCETFGFCSRTAMLVCGGVSIVTATQINPPILLKLSGGAMVGLLGCFWIFQISNWYNKKWQEKIQEFDDKQIIQEYKKLGYKLPVDEIIPTNEKSEAEHNPQLPQEFFLIENGKTTGPFSLNYIKFRIASGELFRDTYCIPKILFGASCPLSTYFPDAPQRPQKNEKSNSAKPPPETESEGNGDKKIVNEPISDAIRHGRVLGLSGKVTYTDIKRIYRQRMTEYHPDKVASLGPKLRHLAEEETKKINAAFEFFTEKNSGRNS